MTNSSSALSVLRQATSVLHSRLEEILPVIGEDAGTQEFVEYLQDMWGWMHPFEERLWQFDWPTEMLVHERKGKLKRIETDLHHYGLGEDIVDLPKSYTSQALECRHARFGVAYVLEGAELGIQVLGRRLAGHLGDMDSAWLKGYGTDSKRNWKLFLDCLEANVTTPEARQLAAESAARTFESLIDWCLQQQAHRKRLTSAPSTVEEN